MRSFVQSAKQFFALSMSVIGTLWTCIEVVDFFYPDELEKYITPGIIPLIAIIIPILVRIYKNYSFTCSVGDQGELCIKYGNLLHQKRSSIVVNINNEIRTPQKPNGSLHWKIVSGRGGEDFRKGLEEERKNLNGQKAPMGYIIDLNHKRKHVLFLVSATLHEKGKSMSNPDDLMKAYHELFSNQAGFQAKNHTMSIPVSGTGRAGINMTFEEVIEMIAREYIICCVQREPNSTKRIHKLNIIIYPKDRKNIKDWNALCSKIDAMAQLCGECQQL